jgi:hypothetical protein
MAHNISELNIVLTIIGVILLLAGLASLIYQFFSSSTLTILGIICLNYAWSWFNWLWMVWFIILWLLAILSGFVITASEGQKLLQKNTWMPVVGTLIGAIFIPIPFLGALIGVFIGTLFALCINEPTLNKEKLDQALSLTFKSFLGLAIEVGAVLTMVFSTVLLAIF